MGASFAISHCGELYRWGANQVDETSWPILNRFGDKINYSSEDIVYKQAIPSKFSKRYIDERVVAVEAGHHFYFALLKSGRLLGWGIC